MTEATQAVQERIETIFEEAGVTGHLYAREIGGTKEITVNADEPVILASVFKIAVLIAFGRAVAAGELDVRERATVTARYRIGGVGFAGFSQDVDVSLGDLALNMMSMSDNAATDVLYHRLGKAAVDQVVTDLGMTNTQILGCCEDLFASIAEDLGVAQGVDIDEAMEATEPGRLLAVRALNPLQTNGSTPRDVAAMLTALWTGEAAPDEGTALATGIMAQQIWPHRLRSGFGDGVQIAAKTGTLYPWRNEAGVVTYPDGKRYVVATFTRAHTLEVHLPAADASIGRAAAAAVAHLRGE